MNLTEKMMAWAQIAFSALLFGFVAAVFLVFETGHAHLNADELKIYERDVGWLKDAALVVLYFWFQRARQGGIPDPSQTVTQTHTLPDGSKSVITSPVGSTQVVAAPLDPTQGKPP